MAHGAYLATTATASFRRSSRTKRSELKGLARNCGKQIETIYDVIAVTMGTEKYSPMSIL